jgi:hypothetical protein
MGTGRLLAVLMTASTRAPRPETPLGTGQGEPDWGQVNCGPSQGCRYAAAPLLTCPQSGLYVRLH